MFRFACNGEVDIMAYRVFLDSFSGEITDLKRGQRTQENMLAVLAQHPLVSTWDMSEHAWVRNEIANMVKDELIVSVEQPYPWLRYELTDKGRALEPAFEAISNGLQRLITDRLSEEEAALLDRLLDKCVNG